MNDMIGIFKASGIVNFYISRYADEKFKKVNMDNEGPSKLTVYHFVGIFQLWMFGLAVASVLFVGEKCDNFLRKLRQNAKKTLKMKWNGHGQI